MVAPLTVAGLHHVTAIAGEPQRNLDFYRQLPGMQLVKLTVNFDDPTVHHLYFGDGTGSPGSIYTSFPYMRARQGRAGPGMISTIAFALPDAETHADALAARGMALERSIRFGAPVWSFTDPDGQPLELTEGVAGLHGATLWLDDPAPEASLLSDVFGYRETAREAQTGGERRRLELPGQAPGRVIELWQGPADAQGRAGAGTVHHIAFRARDRAHQDALAKALRARGLQPTDRKDRNYFESIYFRTPGGLLFEIATDAPGFAADEPADALGRVLKLPPMHEPRRGEIEAALPPLDLSGGD